MTDKQFIYILKKYPFYESEYILMVSLSCDEIITQYTREFRKLNNGYGLVVVRYEISKLYERGYGKTIRHIEKDNDKITDLKKIHMEWLNDQEKI